MKTYRIIIVASYLLAGACSKAELPDRYVDAAALNCTFSVQLQSAPLKPKNSPLPRPTKQVLPDYPVAMRLIGASGVVKLRIKITPDGAIDQINILQATNPAFETATTDAVRGWRFLPTLENDKPVAVERDYTVEFRMVIPD